MLEQSAEDAAREFGKTVIERIEIDTATECVNAWTRVSWVTLVLSVIWWFASPRLFPNAFVPHYVWLHLPNSYYELGLLPLAGIAFIALPIVIGIGLMAVHDAAGRRLVLRLWERDARAEKPIVWPPAPQVPEKNDPD